MVYEGDVDVINDAGTAFTFDSQAGVDWLQMYVDMVAAGTVDNTVLTTKDDRVGLLLFSAGQAAFYATGPNLVREVKSNNATLYENLAMAPTPVGKSGVLGKGLMSISVNKATKFPNASIALAQFFTNPRSMVQFAKQVAVYPSSPAAYDDPFFAEAPTAVEDSARPLAEGIISTYQDIVPTIPKKADVNHRPQRGRVGAVQQGSRAAGPERRRRRGQQAHPVGSGLSEPSTAHQRGPSSGPVPPPARSCPPQERAGTLRREWR